LPSVAAIPFASVAAQYAVLERGQHAVTEFVMNANQPYLKTMMVLSGMGLFFGLSLVMVRVWDDEVRPAARRRR